MDNTTQQVFDGFLRLSPSQKNDLIDALNAFVRATESQKGMIIKEMEQRVNLGPLASTKCRYCGR